MNQKFTYKLDFKKLRDWRSNNDNKFPILGWIDFYRACGVLDEITPIMKEKNRQICPMEIMFCNYNTAHKIRELILESWEKFNIEIIGDNDIRWIPNSIHDQRKRGKKVKAIVKHSLWLDERNFHPMFDGDLENDILVCQILDPEDVAKLEEEAKKEEDQELN